MNLNRELKNVSKMWIIPETSKGSLENINNVFKSKHGMFANIPLVCKGNNCPYFETCLVDAKDRLEGSRCLLEISAIITRFEEYCKHFGIEADGDEINPKDLVDVSMIRDIVDLEIQILRAESKIAISGDFMAAHIAQVDKKCNAYYEDVIHPASEYKDKLVDKRLKILGKLNATRKDKAALLSEASNYSNKAKTIIDTIKEKVGDIDIDNIDAINNSLNYIDI